ncbi:MAG: hypothetical protein ACFCUL_06210 [Flavobacteriaceae bacterium]
MNNKNLKVALAFGILAANSIFAVVLKTEKEEFDINTVVFIEEEPKIELGFNTADWLPENFDPYKAYFDLNTIIYIEAEFVPKKKLARRLPKDFDPFSHPTNVMSMDYIDLNDEIELDFDSKEHLPEGFDPYIR